MAKASRATWISLGIATATLFIVAGVRGSIGAFVLPMQRSLGWDVTTISLGVALNTVSFGLGQTLMSGLVGRFGVRRVMFWSVCVIAASGAALYFVRSPWYFWVVYGLVPGLCYAGGGQVPGTEIVARHFPERQVGPASGLLVSALPGGQILLVPLATLLLGALGFRWAYVVLGGLTAVLALPLIWFGLPPDGPPPDRPPPDRPPRGAAGGPPPEDGAAAARHPFWDVLSDPVFRLLAMGYVACGFSDQMMMVHLIPFAVRAGVTPIDASLLQSLLAAAGVGGALLVGALTARAAPHLVLAGDYLTRALSYAFLLGGVHPLRPAFLVAFGVTFGVTFMGNQPPAVPIAIARFGRARTRQVIANLTTIHHLAGAVGITLAGLSVDRLGTYVPAFLAAAGLLVLGSVASLAIRRAGPTLEQRPPRASQRVHLES